jgi:hypothetical protein
VLDYIELAERKQYEIHKRPSFISRDPWYDLSSAAVIGDFIFPSKIGEKYRLIDNRNAKVYCDKVNYALTVREEYSEYSDIIFLILNSITFRYFIDLFSRQLTGSQTLSDVDVNLVEKTLILNPKLLISHKKELKKIFNSIKSREQEIIHEEVLKADKLQLDTLILEAIGLSQTDVQELYRAASNYVKDRQEKSDSLITTKVKKKLSYDEAVALVKDRFAEIRKFKKLLNGLDTRKFEIPEWKAKYPKDEVGSDNLFGIYNVYFQQGNSQKVLSFDNPSQLNLFRFLNKKIEVKGVKILLPVSEKDCDKILKQLESDFNAYSNQIKSILKSNRSNANYISVYHDILFS